MEIKGLYYKGTDNYEHKFIYDLAKSFKLSANLIKQNFEQRDKESVLSDNSIFFLVITLNTNLSFSCELILKALLLKYSNKTARGHNLSILFKKLDLNLQVKIETLVHTHWIDTENPIGNFHERLKENSLAFEKLRYVYEGDIGFSFTFISIFSDALINVYES